GFKKWFDESARRVVELVLVGIDSFVALVEGCGHQLQGLRVEQVVMVEEADELAARKVEGLVSRRTDSTIGRELDTHPVVQRCESVQHSAQLAVVRSIVNDAPLP